MSADDQVHVPRKLRGRPRKTAMVMEELKTNDTGQIIMSPEKICQKQTGTRKRKGQTRKTSCGNEVVKQGKNTSNDKSSLTLSPAVSEAASTKENEPLNTSDVICPICLEVKIQPVTMPCSHELCFSCFESNVQKANLECPFCRRRIGVWSRRSHKTNKLVNEERWKEIQEKFPDLVAARLEGRDDVDSVFELDVPTRHQFAKPGEIRKEYEAELERLQREERERALQEERASAELIAKLHEEELASGAHLEEICAQDEALARELEVSELHATRKNTHQIPAVAATPTPPKRSRRSSSSVTQKEALNNSMYLYLSQRSSPQATGTTNRTSSLEAQTVEDGQPGRNETPSLEAPGPSGLQNSPVHFLPIKAAPLTPSKRKALNDEEIIVKPEAVKSLFATSSHAAGEEAVDDVFGIDSLDGLAPEVLAAQRELEKRVEQEKADREMARKIQKELLQQERAAMVSRVKGSGNEYSFRRKTDSKQPTLQETLKRRQTSSK